MKPSEITESYWLYSRGGEFGFSSNIHRGTGKWLVYAKTLPELDEVWEKIDAAITEEGIAPLAKAATARENETQSSHGAYVICVYVHSYVREEENKRVLQGLRRAGIKGKLKFKRDLETYRGIYGKDSFYMYSPRGEEVVRYAWTKKQ